MTQYIQNFIDESMDIQYGDLVTFVYNIINNYFSGPFYNIVGSAVGAGNGIRVRGMHGSSGRVVSVRDGKGLDASSGPLHVELTADKGLQFSGATDAATLEVEYNTQKAVNCDGDGLKVTYDTSSGMECHTTSGLQVNLSTSVETGSGGGGGGLSFDGANGIRVDPEDFLKLS
jgi:hypothetical protein